KNPQTLASHIVTLLQARYIWILTATPMLNRAIDFLGYLSLLWKSEMDLCEEELPEGSLELYMQDVEPEESEGYKKDQAFDWQKHRLPLWRLNPYMYRHLMAERQRDISALKAFRALRAI